jgi:hypothetical protein
MAAADQIKSLLKSHIEGDETRFFSIAMQLAANEARKGHGKLAQELRTLIDEARSKSTINESFRKPISIAQPRGELAELLFVTHPQIRLSDMILDSKILKKLERLIKEQQFVGKLQSH